MCDLLLSLWPCSSCSVIKLWESLAAGVISCWKLTLKLKYLCFLLPEGVCEFLNCYEGAIIVLVILLSIACASFCLLFLPSFPHCFLVQSVGWQSGVVLGEGEYFRRGVTWHNSHECRKRMKKIKKFCFSELEDSLHDFPTDGIMCFQAEILLTIQMEIEGTGGADSHINLICP